MFWISQTYLARAPNAPSQRNRHHSKHEVIEPCTHSNKYEILWWSRLNTYMIFVFYLSLFKSWTLWSRDVTLKPSDGTGTTSAISLRPSTRFCHLLLDKWAYGACGLFFFFGVSMFRGATFAALWATLSALSSHHLRSLSFLTLLLLL